MSEDSEKHSDAAVEMMVRYLKEAPSRGHSMSDAINVISKFGIPREKAFSLIVQYKKEINDQHSKKLKSIGVGILVDLIICFIGAIPYLFEFEMNAIFWVILCFGILLLCINVLSFFANFFRKEIFPMQ